MNDKLFESSAEPEKHTNEELYYKQIEMLKGFLERGAISQAQYDKSAGDLTRLMGFADNKNTEHRNMKRKETFA